MSASVGFHKKAYTKMLLHAAKYPHCAVNGVLLVSETATDKTSPTKLEFADCVPLFHLNLQLLPMLEVALSQVEAYCERNGLLIAGYYQANENVRHSDFDHQRHGYDAIAHRIVEKIYENNSKAYLVMIQNDKMGLSDGDCPVKIYECRDGKLVEGIQAVIDPDSAALDVVARGEFSKLVDFDNHLDDVRLDWTNAHLSAF